MSKLFLFSTRWLALTLVTEFLKYVARFGPSPCFSRYHTSSLLTGRWMGLTLDSFSKSRFFFQCLSCYCQRYFSSLYIYISVNVVVVGLGGAGDQQSAPELFIFLRPSSYFFLGAPKSPSTLDPSCVIPFGFCFSRLYWWARPCVGTVNLLLYTNVLSARAAVPFFPKVVHFSH